MTKKNVFEIGLRLFGLYLLFQVPFAFLGVGMAFAQDTTQFITNVTLYKLVVILTPVTYFIFSFVFLFKAPALTTFFVKNTELDDNQSTHCPSVYKHLPFWVIIIGLFYSISSFSSIIDELIKLPISSPKWYFWGSILSHTVALLLAFIFIFRSNKVVELMFKYSSNGTDNQALNSDG